MNQEKYNLSWHTYTDHLKEMLHHIMNSNELTDITLVSEDRKIFKAHKVVLSACSSVFKSIINDGSQSNQTVFLRGIQSTEIESALQFMYLGEATIYQERTNEFLNVANSLEIKEISNNIDMPLNDHMENQYIYHTSQAQTFNIDDEDSKHISVSQRQIRSNPITSDQEGTVYVCVQCNIQYSANSSLLRHKKAAHSGIKYPCNQCSYKASYQSDLPRHIKSFHRN